MNRFRKRDTYLKCEYFFKALQTGEFNGNPNVLEDYAMVLLELGRFEDAKSLLVQSIQLSPDEGFSKYMTLGQLSSGREALGFFEKGIELLIRKHGRLQNAGKHQKALELTSQLAAAYVSASEIYLTDCCFDEGAEQRAEQFIQLALNAAPQSCESHQALASLRISQTRTEEALQSLLHSYSLWKGLI